MDQIIVKHVDGSTQKLQSKEAGSAIRSAKQTVERLGQDVVDISVESVTKLTFQIGDKITVIGRDYTLNQPARESKVSSEMYKYDLQFEGVQYDLMRANYNVNVDTSSSEIQDLAGDTITGDLKMFLDVLIANATRVFPGKWVLGSYPESTETKTLTFADDDSCLTVLQMLCSEDNYNTEFKIDIDQNGVRTLRVGEFGNVFPFTFEHKRGKGLYNLTREKLSTSNIITKLFVYGSSKNINTSKYRASKLCLPLQTKAQSYIENSDAIAKYGVWEKTITFDEVFPKIPGRPTGPGFITGLGVNVYEFYDAAMDEFDLNEKDAEGNTLCIIPGVAPKVHFNTGNLAGYEFEIIEYDHMSRLFTIKGFTDENGYSFPDPDNSAFQFAENDDYVLVDIYMPKTYIADAEERLSAKGEEHLSKHSTPQVQYGLEIDKTFLDTIVGGDVDQNIFWTGDYIPVLDADFELNRSVRVKSFTRDLLDDYPSYSGLKIADFTTSVTLLTRIVSDIKGIDSIVKINNLNDPARARRNWKVTTELITMLETIQAEAALIGNDPAAQYTLSQASFKTNIGGDPNSFFASNCIIAHNYYPVGNPGSWIVSQLSAGELDNQPYYLYIKADKAHGGALFLLSLTKISVESVAGFYHFPVGVLSSVVDGRRSFQTTKGYTLITGGDIKTGRISSTDGQKYFDLDTGEIKGSFKFVSGESVEDTIAAADTAANAAAQLAADADAAAQAAQEDADAALEELTDILSDGVLSASEKPSQRQAWDIVASEKSALESQADTFDLPTEKATYTAAFFSLADYLNGGESYQVGTIPDWLTDSNLSVSTVFEETDEIGGSTYRSKWKAYYDARTFLLNAVSLKAKTIADNIVVGGKNLVLKSLGTYAAAGAIHFYGLSEPLIIGHTYSVSVKGDVGAGASFNVWVNKDLQPVLNLSASGIAKGTFEFGGGDYPSEISVYSENSATPSTVYWVKIEKGNKPTDWTPAPEDIEYLTNAMKDGSTDIDGGLVTTNVIMLKNNDATPKVVGGLSGIAADPVASWFGGTYAEAITDAARDFKASMTTGGMDKKDGSGHRAKGNFAWDADGDVAVKGELEATKLIVSGSMITPLTDIVLAPVSMNAIAIEGRSFVACYLSQSTGAYLPSAASYDGYHCIIGVKANSAGTLALYDNNQKTRLALLAPGTSAEVIAMNGKWLVRVSNESYIFSKTWSPGIGGTWYRIFSDGWVEQGGNYTVSGSGTVTLPIEMYNEYYTVHVNGIRSTSGASGHNYVWDRTQSSFLAIIDSGSGFTWSVSGKSLIY